MEGRLVDPISTTILCKVKNGNYNQLIHQLIQITF